jgi:transcriptional regulator with XRE-family HTH domain
MFVKGAQKMYAVFGELLQKFGVTPYKVSKETGVTQTSLSNWKSGKSTPSTQNLQKIADYFGVSVEYLITGKEPETGYYLNEETAKMAQAMYEDADMRSLFDMKRNMSQERFSAHVDFMRKLYEQEHGND